MRKCRRYRQNHPYSSEFMIMARRGDIKLAMHSDSVAWELFGRDNRGLTQLILDDWKSNDTWMELALSYKFEQYIIWIPKSVKESIHKGEMGKNKKTDKFWADLWEAWWAGVFLEREMWGDDIDDLMSVLRRLMFLKYRQLAEHYSTACFLDRNQSNIPFIATDDQVLVTDIHAKDERIKKYLGKTSSLYTNDLIPYGYLATLPIPVDLIPDSNVSPGTDSHNISVFSMKRDIAISKTLAYAREGYTGMIHIISLWAEKQVLRKELPPIVHDFKHCDRKVREVISNYMTKEWPSVRSNPDDIHPIYNFLKDMKQEFIAKTACPTKDLAKLFWYEVCSLTA